MSAPQEIFARESPAVYLDAARDGKSAPTMNLHLTEADLKFIVETVATRRRDHDHIIALVRDKDDLLEPMLDDPKLAERLVNDPAAFVHVSPGLLFAVLLRRIRSELEHEPFVRQPDAAGKTVPVFVTAELVQLLGDADLRDYLAEMLGSFARTHTRLLHWQERGRWRKRGFNDADMDDLLALCALVEPPFKPRLYKRIADLALFLTGIYPEQASFFVRRRRSQNWRLTPDYEREGRRFYSLAAQEPQPPWSASVFEALAEKFALAREALNALSARYLQPLREQYFQRAAE